MFRVGTTSYIVPDNILPNVEYLAPLVDDVELVLFETDEYGSNLPDARQVARLRELAAQQNLTYTVHLPLDLRLAEDGSAGHVSLLKARRVIDATAGLDPFAYTLHLDARELGDAPAADALARWQENSARALETVGGWLPTPALLAVENLEKWDPAWFAPVLGRVPVSRTMDVGHLWLAGLDPIPFLTAWCDRARIVHLHGVGSRDHESLSHAPQGSLDAVIGLLSGCFDGVVTLEVFSQPDFLSSLAALRASLERHGLKWSKNGG